MNKFKIGDRVENEVRDLGTIINIDRKITSVMTYLVEYDDKITDGHDGNVGNIKGESGHCWWETEFNIKKVEDENMKDAIKDASDENRRLKDCVEGEKCSKEFYRGVCHAYATNMKELRDRIIKQKEINKELVDENEKLKAEVKKLKFSNREIEVYDTVEIVNKEYCFSRYKDWATKYLSPIISSRFKGGYVPENGDIGLVVAKAKHEYQDKMLYAVLIDGQVYIIGEQGLKLHSN